MANNAIFYPDLTTSLGIEAYEMFQLCNFRHRPMQKYIYYISTTSNSSNIMTLALKLNPNTKVQYFYLLAFFSKHDKLIKKIKQIAYIAVMVSDKIDQVT